MNNILKISGLSLIFAVLISAGIYFGIDKTAGYPKVTGAHIANSGVVKINNKEYIFLNSSAWPLGGKQLAFGGLFVNNRELFIVQVHVPKIDSPSKGFKRLMSPMVLIPSELFFDGETKLFTIQGKKKVLIGSIVRSTEGLECKIRNPSNIR